MNDLEEINLLKQKLEQSRVEKGNWKVSFYLALFSFAYLFCIFFIVPEEMESRSDRYFATFFLCLGVTMLITSYRIWHRSRVQTNGYLEVFYPFLIFVPLGLPILLVFTEGLMFCLLLVFALVVCTLLYDREKRLNDAITDFMAGQSDESQPE